MKLDEIKSSRRLAAMKKASRIAKENGMADMSLEEINAEIAKARRKKMKYHAIYVFDIFWKLCYNSIEKPETKGR